MLADKSEVLQMIPQKPPMVMVDTLVSHTKLSTTSELALSKQNIFCENGYFHEPGLIENMAQTAALRAGYQAQKNNTKPLVGFIGAVKKLKILSLPKDLDVLETKVTVLTEIANATIIKGEIHCGSTLIAEGEMSIFKKES